MADIQEAMADIPVAMADIQEAMAGPMVGIMVALTTAGTIVAAIITTGDPAFISAAISVIPIIIPTGIILLPITTGLIPIIIRRPPPIPMDLIPPPSSRHTPNRSRTLTGTIARIPPGTIPM